MIDYKKELSEVQYQAVTYIDGPELVIAGAGSGKTRVLTYKIAYLIERGIPSNQILALTFTNKASNEMKERIATLVSRSLAHHIVMGTFHSVFARILRTEVNHSRGVLPYTQNFTIYDASDSETTVKNIIKSMGLDTKVYSPSLVAGRISKAKNNMVLPEYYIHSSIYAEDRDRHISKTYEIYRKYQHQLIQSNAMDFDDLLLNTWLLFRNNEDIHRRYAGHFRYCLVDEYQDTNRLQKEILLQLTKESQKLCAVGDDAQSIYAFRGAVIGNILHYDSDFPSVAIYKLEENYRSTKTIVHAANSIIKKNVHQIYKHLFSNNEQGEKLTLYRGDTDRYETRYVVGTIRRLAENEQRDYKDFAVLYRQNWLSRSFEEALRKEGIPYRIYGGTSFYQRKEVKDVLAYFRVVVNATDEQALRRIINYPARGIGDTTLQKLIEISVASEKPLWEVITHPRLYVGVLSKATVTKLTAFYHLIQKWQDMQSIDAFSLATSICKESGIVKLFKSSSKEDDQERYENIQELLAGVSSFVAEHRNEEGSSVSLDNYLREIALYTDDENTAKDNTPCVSLMTVHAAKGLEFPVVFVVGMDEDVFPCRQAFEDISSMEEERRLFYVAVTRAKQRCYLTGADNRFRNGSFSNYDTSSFIDDIDRRYIQKDYSYGRY